eukprot:TRINITY_DN4533_c0_g1_i1.p1 TRINITY_DN4533_c0_g1~~TRINITY_DN4533_c0_g1_i1.p1  ORF type:complete len:110 (+),score=26.77 TRINITY_DN4533_c0_g1_i1:51-380(+)
MPVCLCSCLCRLALSSFFRLILLHSVCFFFFFFLMIRRPPRSTHCISSAASDVYKRQGQVSQLLEQLVQACRRCLLYTSDAADDMQCVDLGGRRIIKKKKKGERERCRM